MKLADFKKITQGVKLSDTKEIDFDKFREELFHRVEREPFTLEEDEDARLKLESGQHANKKLLFDKEREGILRRGATMLKQTERNNKFVDYPKEKRLRFIIEILKLIVPYRAVYEQCVEGYATAMSWVQQHTNAGMCPAPVLLAKLTKHFNIRRKVYTFTKCI